MNGDATVAAFGELPTATISDALDRLGIAGQASGIAPLSPEFRLAGRAWTVRYRPVSATEPGNVGDYIDLVPSGAVVVIDNAGRLDCTVWGGILTAAAHRRGVAGTVINGICRDVTQALDLSYPLFSRGRWMRTGKDRVEIENVNTPVSLGDIQVRPGDVLVGDADGIVVIPAHREEDVLTVARRIDKAERAIETAVAADVRLEDARRQYGYHQLQQRA